MIRAFVALTLPHAMRYELEGMQAGLTVGRLVPPENYHLTLMFLGEHPRPVLEDLHLELEAITSEPIELALRGVDVFGGSSPRALFAAVAPTEVLKSLRAKVLRAAGDAGIEPDRRRFHPHITLSRFSGLGDEDRLELDQYIARRLEISAGPFLVSSFGLYRSTLRNGPPVYGLMAEYPIG